MGGRLVIRVHPDDRVEVKVEGLTDTDHSKPKGRKLCESITRRLEEDLGSVVRREYEGDGAQRQAIEVTGDESVKLGDS